MPPEPSLTTAMDGEAYNRPSVLHLVSPAVIGLVVGIFGTAALAEWREALRPCGGLASTLQLAMVMSLIAGLQLPSALRTLAGAAPPASAFSHRRSRAEPAGRQLGAEQAEWLRVIGTVCLLLAGAAMIVLRTAGPGIAALHAVALAGYHWTPFTLHVLDLLLALLLVFVPLLCLGVALNCAQRLSLVCGRRSSVVAAGFCSGLAAGLALAPELGALPATVVMLVAGLCAMVPALLEIRPLVDVVSCDDGDGLPASPDRGQLHSRFMLGVSGFLILVQMLIWTSLASSMGLARTPAWLVAALALGWLAGHGSARQGPGVFRRPAILCLANAVALAAGMMLGGLFVQIEEQGAGWRVLAGVLILLPALSGGALHAVLLEGLSQSTSRPSSGVLRGWTATGLGLAGGLLAAAGGITDELQPYEWLAVLSLSWLGLALLDAVQGHLGRATAGHGLTATGVLAALLALCAGSAREPESWQRLGRGLASATRGRLTVVGSLHKADVLLAQLEAPQSIEPSTARSGRAPMTPERMLRRLVLLREPCAAVYLDFDSAGLRAVPPALFDDLAALVHSRLGPDGYMLVAIRDAHPQDASAAALLRRMTRIFTPCTCLADPHGCRLLAFRGPSRPEPGTPAVARR